MDDFANLLDGVQPSDRKHIPAWWLRAQTLDSESPAQDSAPPLPGCAAS